MPKHSSSQHLATRRRGVFADVEKAACPWAAVPRYNVVVSGPCTMDNAGWWFQMFQFPAAACREGAGAGAGAGADTNCGHHCTNIRHAYNRFHLSKYSLIFTLLYNYIYSKLINAQMRWKYISQIIENIFLSILLNLPVHDHLQSISTQLQIAQVI